MNKLPDDLTTKVFSFLGALDLYDAERVCTDFRMLANQQHLWQDLMDCLGTRSWPPLPDELTNAELPIAFPVGSIVDAGFLDDRNDYSRFKMYVHHYGKGDHYGKDHCYCVCHPDHWGNCWAFEDRNWVFLHPKWLTRLSAPHVEYTFAEMKHFVLMWELEFACDVVRSENMKANYTKIFDKFD